MMRELSIKRGQTGKFRNMLRRSIARSSDSSNSTAGRVPKVLTASRLVQQGLRTVWLVGLLVLIDIYAPRFFRYQTLVNILLQVSLLGLMTIGMTVVMIAGGIDLSLPANMAIGAVLCAIYMRSGGNWIVSCFIIVCVGGLVGVIKRNAVLRLRKIPIVV